MRIYVHRNAASGQHILYIEISPNITLPAFNSRFALECQKFHQIFTQPENLYGFLDTLACGYVFLADLVLKKYVSRQWVLERFLHAFALNCNGIWTALGQKRFFLLREYKDVCVKFEKLLAVFGCDTSSHDSPGHAAGSGGGIDSVATTTIEKLIRENVASKDVRQKSEATMLYTKRLKVLEAQKKIQEKTGADYILRTPDSADYEGAIHLQHMMGKLMFTMLKGRAEKGAEEAGPGEELSADAKQALFMMYDQFLVEDAINLTSTKEGRRMYGCTFTKEMVRKQLESEYGVDPESCRGVKGGRSSLPKPICEGQVKTRIRLEIR